MGYRDRVEAGQVLASRLAAFVDRADVLVLALPRGGVPVAYEVAADLHVPLDVFVVRKLLDSAQGAAWSRRESVLPQEGK